ncbi:elongation factor 4 [bacterium CG10_46_32]|nr:MAG: elongation factor 4 [bacterium CG10_46_32]PIR55637.1 MAG: elongation factor 4 [Parcubacteria group bacterium CG10_big_fil_rev_8_21_14_0_10_46_32]
MTVIMTNIRNFCIIAHIDHGKSTLADRFLELTHTVASRDMKAQMLDQMDLERERGITIKLQPVRMEYNGYILNLIDTPGHVDFSYEVSRSLQAVEGAILLVDASQGVEAQTLANLYLAIEQNLVVIPVINKIDLPAADVPKVTQELTRLLGVTKDEILLASGKSGQGVVEILDSVIKLVPAPQSTSKKTQALIFDSLYDDYRGVVAFVRVISGAVKKGDIIHFISAEKDTHALEVGTFKPKFNPKPDLTEGEIGYIVTGFKEVGNARVGDTVTLAKDKATALPGYKEVKPMVFAGIFPESGDEYPKLRDAMDQVNLTDAALQFEQEQSKALGFGYRCGFLGMLHMEIIAERLKREHGLHLVVTTPSVAYEIHLQSGTSIIIHSPQELPDASHIAEIREPWVRAEIVSPKQYVGGLMSLIQERHGLFGTTEYLDEIRVVLHFEIPLAGLITDFYDTLKSASSGYASLNYEFKDYRKADIVRLDIWVGEEVVEAFSLLIAREDAYAMGKRMVAKLKDIIPKQQFVIKLQAAVGSKIIAAERIQALRKDVTKGLYGGDVTRKRKLLEKQKKGKKRMGAHGHVEIPARAFLEVLKR